MREISRTLNVSLSAVAKSIKHYDETGSHEDSHRKGRQSLLRPWWNRCFRTGLEKSLHLLLLVSRTVQTVLVTTSLQYNILWSLQLNRRWKLFELIPISDFPIPIPDFELIPILFRKREKWTNAKFWPCRVKNVHSTMTHTHTHTHTQRK